MHGFIYDGMNTWITCTMDQAATFGRDHDTTTNSFGVTVGSIQDAAGEFHGTITQNGVTTIFDYPDGPIYQCAGTWLTGVNDSGLIIGQALTGPGIYTGFELIPTPVPLPSTLLFLSSGLLGLAGIRYRFGKS